MYNKSQGIRKETYSPLEQKGTKDKLSDLETKTVPFKGKSALEIEINKEPEDYKVKIDKAGAICVFYICHLPFIEC